MFGSCAIDLGARTIGGLRLALHPDFPDSVDASPLAFEIGTHQNLSQQPCTKHHQASKEQQGAGDQQRTVL